jgi:hypothetical protein
VAVVSLALPLTACEEVTLYPAAPGEASPAADPDESLLSAARRLEGRIVLGLQPLLRHRAEPVRRLARQGLAVHEAHLEALDDRAAPGGGAARLRAAGQVVEAEEALARRHTDLAVRAQSGPFARVLAGMAAASAQQADLWREMGPR